MCPTKQQRVIASPAVALVDYALPGSEKAVKNAPSQPDFWTRLENNMLATVVSVIEISLLIFAATRALFSIVSPKVSGGLYYLMVILPLALLMPALRAEATKTDIHDD